MLAGEHFGGGHEHGLEPVGHGQKHGVDRHDCLPRADVALEQPVHRHIAAMSAEISAMACCWPGVSSKGKSRRMRASIFAVVSSGGARRPACWRCRFMARANWRMNSSW